MVETAREFYDLALTPSGGLLLLYGGERFFDPWMKRVARAFGASWEAGLFAMAAGKPQAPPPPAFSFWRDFACLYLGRLCRLPEGGSRKPPSIPPPPDHELWSLVASSPPMTGGEYLAPEVLRSLWKGLDSWVRRNVALSGGGVAGWLKKEAPLWHQVGRVCFHLAENKKDPEFPFAFLATYAPRLSKGGRVQYLPLGRALKEYAGQRNKRALIHLLSPVHRASEKLPWVKDLVDSGEIYHPLAWTPSEAYALLRSIPVLEESGLLVRVPDWWGKRSKPKVTVTIGEKKKTRLHADAMLDFKVDLALGDQKLTREEWRRLMASEDGLVLIKGRWIEVDREKLDRAVELAFTGDKYKPHKTLGVVVVYKGRIIAERYAPGWPGSSAAAAARCAPCGNRRTDFRKSGCTRYR